MRTGFVWHLTKPTTPGSVARVVVTPRGPDGSHVDRSKRVERDIGRNHAIARAAELLAAAGAPKQLLEQVESLKSPEDDDPDDAETITAGATAAEIGTVERLVSRWLSAVEQALKWGTISKSTAIAYSQHPKNFLAWVKGEFRPGGQTRRPQKRSDS